MLRLFFSLFLLLCWLKADTMEDGLTYLNDIRNKIGLITLEKNNYLSIAATAHAKYLIQNQTNGHYQKKGKYAYTGSTPSERIIKAGYPSTLVMENLSLNTAGHKKSIDNLFSAIYHRFVFLNFDKDEIGLGVYRTKKNRKIKQAYVYDLASSTLAKICKKSYIMLSGEYYMKNICKDSEHMVPQNIFKEKEDEIRRKNNSIILYPYDGQKDIWPAFYNESPDPLPQYKVSGFPISVQFNPVKVRKVQLKSFKMYDESGKEIKKVKVLHKNNDQNNILTDLEFALMPLARLEFDTTYSVVFEAKVDGSMVKKEWSFRTKAFKNLLYRVNQNKTTLKVKSGSTIILYMVPNTRHDILHGYTAKGNVKATFLDQNTLEVTLPEKDASGELFIMFDKYKKVSFI